jgi:3-phenylpropionate/cinnamic acid dioxygenase small subunit
LREDDLKPDDKGATVSDQQSVNQLFSTYAWAIDAREFDLLNGVFSEDASFVVSIAGTVAAGPFEGRTALVDFISSTTREQTDQRRHVITNVRIAGDDQATATLTLLVVDGGVLTVKSCGFYRVELVQEGGAWRIRMMDLALDLGF